MPKTNFVLGTAQLGGAYGIANKTGQPKQAVVRNIINVAWENGVREFDTAQTYGKSEEALGEALTTLGINNEAKVITKLNTKINCFDASAVRDDLEESIRRLKVPCLYGLMLHREEYLEQWKKGLGEILLGLVRNGYVDQLGISVYSPNKAMQALETNGLKMIQIPTNLLDRRFLQAGVFLTAEEKEKHVYVRSIFLQGLLTMSSDDLPEKMEFCRGILEKLDLLSQEFGMSRIEMALGYLKMGIPQAHIIFGAETPEQIQENFVAWKKNVPATFVNRSSEVFTAVDELILNPSLWPQCLFH